MNTFTDKTIRTVAAILVALGLVTAAASTAQADDWQKIAVNGTETMWMDNDSIEFNGTYGSYDVAVLDRVDGMDVEVHVMAQVNCKAYRFTLSPMAIYIDDINVTNEPEMMSFMQNFINQNMIGMGPDGIRQKAMTECKALRRSVPNS